MPVPRSRSELLPESFISHLSDHVAGFNGLAPLVQHDMAYLAWVDGTWQQRQHAGLDGYMSIHYRELERRFGRSGFQRANAAVQMFEVTQQWRPGLTRGYRLTSKVAAIKSKYLHDGDPRLTHLIQNDGKRMRTIPDAIAAKNTEGRLQTVWRNARVVNKVPVDVPRLKRLYDRLTLMRDDLRAGRGSGDLYPTTVKPENVPYYRDVLAQFLCLTNTTVAGAGYVPIRYSVSRSGRLYALGVSLQTVPGEVRKVALHGLWDYDIENCHYAIFRQMAARFGYEPQAVAAYLAAKKDTRAGIAKRVGISVEQTKECLLAIMYGARATSWDAAAIPVTIGNVAAQRLYADPVVAALLRDIRQGRDTILTMYPKRRTTMVNALNLPIKLSDPPAARLAHLTQGVEAQALRAVQALYPDDIVLLMHDGWVSRKQLDKGRMVQVMRNATEYKFELSEERISEPVM